MRARKMAPRSAQPSKDPQGMFRGMVVFLVPKGVQLRRLQIWKQKLLQMGATVEDSPSKRVTHIFAVNLNSLLHQVNHEYLKQFKGSLLLFEWLEKCLNLGDKVSEDPYVLKIGFEEPDKRGEVLEKVTDSDGGNHKRARISLADSKSAGAVGKMNDQQMIELARPEHQVTCGSHSGNETLTTERGSDICMHNFMSTAVSSTDSPDTSNGEVAASLLSSLYNPPDLNKIITGIFGKLINIYRALGDERRSFSYYKAIPVIEKLPFKIENVDQVKHLPTIGKSMQDHIHEIVTTGKLSKLEHFEQDEKVRTVSLFGEVWGIGPATALKLYEKGHRTLEDLKNDDSLTHSQRIGLKYFDDIKKRIPRHEVKDMEMLLQKAGEDILPGVVIVCGGSYRRGKASCGDLDIVITHPDGESHKGFLPKYVQYLKDMNFLREDLVFSIHSTEGTDSGVDTFFGLCTYPGREERHRTDFKVYPRKIYAFGLIAWTGNDVLNRRLRLLAESKGYRLDDTGLFLATQGSDGKRGVKSSTSIICNTEKEVFDFLGFPWLEPHERNL